MSPKSFLFVASWIRPLRQLPLRQRWNVMQAIAEYATSGIVPESLDPMETLAFGFIRIEIDRMRSYGNARREKYHQSTDVCPEKKLTESEQTFPCAMKEDEIQNTETADALSADDDASDVNACNAEQEDAPYDIISESVSESKSDITSTTTTHAHVRSFFRRRSFLPNGLAMVSFGRYAGGW